MPPHFGLAETMHCLPARLLPKQACLNIARLRLHNQQIAAHRFQRPDQVVAWLGALQAQDYPGALWSIGLRLPCATQADVENAISARTIVRTWPMRGTLHFVAATDLHWMRALLTPRIIDRSALRQRQLELSTPVFARCEKIFLKALRGGRQFTREQMFALLEKSRISTASQRGYHILWRLAQQGLLCFGTHTGKQPTFTLLDEWIPTGKPREREASLAELTRRYFTSHGPATLEDFVAWSGLRISEARAGLDMLSTKLVHEIVADKTYWLSPDQPSMARTSRGAYLLPGFDEYLLGYRNRSPVLMPEDAQRICPGSNGMFIPTVILRGRVAGTWTRVIKKSSVSIDVKPFTVFNTADQRAIALAGKRYSTFLGREIDKKSGLRVNVGLGESKLENP
jgi:hypothetical protein